MIYHCLWTYNNYDVKIQFVFEDNKFSSWLQDMQITYLPHFSIFGNNFSNFILRKNDTIDQFFSMIDFINNNTDDNIIVYEMIEY